MSTLDRSGGQPNSIVFRRFPALAQFTGEELAAVTLPAEPLPGMASTLSASPLTSRVEPSRTLSPLSGFRARLSNKGSYDERPGTRQSQAEQRASTQAARATAPVFTPVNVRTAREAITVRTSGFVLMHGHYDETKEAERERLRAAAEANVSGPFKPTSTAEARATVRSHYFLNSADTETMAAERRFIAERAQANMEDYRSEQREQLLALREKTRRAERRLEEEEAEGVDALMATFPA